MTGTTAWKSWVVSIAQTMNVNVARAQAQRSAPMAATAYAPTERCALGNEMVHDHGEGAANRGADHEHRGQRAARCSRSERKQHDGGLENQKQRAPLSVRSAYSEHPQSFRIPGQTRAGKNSRRCPAPTLRWPDATRPELSACDRKDSSSHFSAAANPTAATPQMTPRRR